MYNREGFARIIGSLVIEREYVIADLIYDKGAVSLELGSHNVVFSPPVGVAHIHVHVPGIPTEYHLTTDPSHSGNCLISHLFQPLTLAQSPCADWGLTPFPSACP